VVEAEADSTVVKLLCLALLHAEIPTNKTKDNPTKTKLR